MCEFCEKIYKQSDIIDYPKIVYGNYCSNESDMYYISVHTDEGIDYSIDNIKFCPMCGRKLLKGVSVWSSKTQLRNLKKE